MGRRSRKRRDPEARNQAVRDGLEPLEPGERPLAVTIAAVAALIIALANLVAYFLGWEVDGEKPGLFGVLVFEVLMLSAAWGMWRSRYWAVLGFEALLGISLIIAMLSLPFSSNWAAVRACLLVIVLTGPLFWFLIRAMARLQMPQGPTR